VARLAAVPLTPDATPMLTTFLRWLSGGDYQYQTTLCCRGYDWVTVGILSAERLAVVAGYVWIAAQFFRLARQLTPTPAKAALVRLVWIFLLCGLCGYGFQLIDLAWPADRLKIPAFAALLWFTARYARAGGLKPVLDQIATGVREHAELSAVRAFADNLPCLAWAAHADGYLYWYNRRWYEYTGTTPAQMEGWGWQKVHHPEHLPNVMTKWRDCIAKGEPFEMNFPLRSASGNYRWFKTRASPVTDDAGRVVEWVGTNTDIEHDRRESQQAETAMRELVRRLDGGQPNG
jgi:PAS domain S-box-containing protein